MVYPLCISYTMLAPSGEIALQKHYKVLQATALNQRDMDIDDKTLPKTENMHVVSQIA